MKVEVDSGGATLVKTAEASLARTATPIEPGELTVSARVRVSYGYRF